MSQVPGKILVIRGGAVGDFILTLPVLAALRAHLPRVRLEVLGYEFIARLALAGGLVETVRSIEARPLAGFFARDGELDAALAAYFADFAVVVSYLYDPDETFQANVCRCTHAQFIAGPHRPDERAGVHATEVFLQPLERLAIFDAEAVPRLAIPPVPRGAAGRWLAVHPGSGGEHKNWPEANWAALLGDLATGTAWNFLIIGGEVEGARPQRLAAALPPARVRLAQHLALPELAAQLAACDAFIGHDSGISHLAAAVGVPALILWGPTVEAVWRPRGERVELLRAPGGMTSLTVATVRERVQAAFGESRGDHAAAASAVLSASTAAGAAGISSSSRPLS